MGSLTVKLPGAFFITLIFISFQLVVKDFWPIAFLCD